MKLETVCLLIFFGGLAIIGGEDRRAAEISHRTAMEAPRPIFEPAHEARQLSMPCTYVKQGGYLEPISAKSTRCTNADLSEKR